MVHPAQRRRGLGRALLKHAVARAAEHGRSVLNCATRRGGDGEAFARSAGAESGLVDVQRVMDVRAIERRAARPAARDGRAGGGGLLAGVVDRAGARGFLERAAALYEAMNDAPHDRIAPGLDAWRVRERVNGLRPHYGLRTTRWRRGTTPPGNWRR